MITTYFVELKTGYDFNSNGLARIRELIDEALRPIGVEYLADITVSPSNFIPGPIQDKETS